MRECSDIKPILRGTDSTARARHTAEVRCCQPSHKVTQYSDEKKIKLIRIYAYFLLKFRKIILQL